MKCNRGVCVIHNLSISEMVNANTIKHMNVQHLLGPVMIMVYHDVYALRGKSIYKERAQHPCQCVQTAYVKMGKPVDLVHKIAVAALHTPLYAGTDNVITVNHVYRALMIAVVAL